MGEAAEKYAERYVEKCVEEYVRNNVTIPDVKNLMESTKFSLEQALNALKIQGEERKVIIKQFEDSFPKKMY